MRTVHQQEAKAQLLVAVGRAAANPWTRAHAAGALPDVAEPQAQLEAATNEKVGAGQGRAGQGRAGAAFDMLQSDCDDSRWRVAISEI